jgi:hypothetical protein
MEGSRGFGFDTENDNPIKHRVNVPDEPNTFIFVPFYILGYYMGHRFDKHHRFITCTAVINDRLVFDMGSTNEVPNASWRPSSSCNAGVK